MLPLVARRLVPIRCIMIFFVISQSHHYYTSCKLSTVFGNITLFLTVGKKALLSHCKNRVKIEQIHITYRPMALTGCFGKILERMVGKPPSYTLEKHNMLSHFQSGFRPNHSPVDHLVRLETDIRQGLKKKNKQHAIVLRNHWSGPGTECWSQGI